MSCFDMVGRPWAAFFVYYPPHLALFATKPLIERILPVFCANNPVNNQNK